MAPTIPVDYTGQRESKNFSKLGSRDSMGKTRKIPKGCSTGFVPDYRHAVEIVGESEVYGISDRVDAIASEDLFAPNRGALNLDGYDRSIVPIQVISLSNMSHLERRELDMRLKTELEQVRKLQRKIASFSADAPSFTPAIDFHSYQDGLKRPAMVESLSMSANGITLGPGKKKYPHGGNGPRAKGGSIASKRNESVKQCVSQSTSFIMLKKQCETLLSRLMSHQHAWIFNEPVDIVKHNIPDYFNVIKHPMDLGTIKNKLLLNQYSSPMGFAADVRLTFKNALTYNPPGHDVHAMAEMLSKFFEVRWKAIEKKIPLSTNEFMASNVIVEPGRAYVPPAKRHKTTSAENQMKYETEKRGMSDVEKQKLGVELEGLLAELPESVIEFLKQSSLNSSQLSEDEIEIDIDTLSDDTLFTLRKLLDEYLREKQEKQATLEPSGTEMHKGSSFKNLSVQPCEDNEPAEEDVDIGRNDPPPISSSPTIEIDKDTARRNGGCSSSRSSSSESGSSSPDSGSSSASELDGAKSSIPAKNVNETVDARIDSKGSVLGDPNSGGFLNGHAEQNSVSNSSSVDLKCRGEGESASPDRQVSPEKLYRAALLRSRFADIIIKAQENSVEKGERPDPEKLKLEKEEIERRRREEKARLQAEAKAAEEARKKAELEAAAEARRNRELEREAARRALQQMEKTVEINENSQFMEDLEMFRAAPDEHLQSFIEEASPENSQNGLGSFKFQGSSNPLEQLGLFMKNDEEEEEEVAPQSSPDGPNEPEEGEID